MASLSEGGHVEKSDRTAAYVKISKPHILVELKGQDRMQHLMPSKIRRKIRFLKKHCTAAGTIRFMKPTVTAAIYQVTHTVG